MSRSVLGQEALPYSEARLAGEYAKNSLVFFVMALFGPSMAFLGLGELTYAEILILLFLGPYFVPALRSLDGWQRGLLFLFVLAAAAHLLSGSINGAPLGATLKRVGTYLILGVLFLVMNHLTRSSSARLQCAVAGLCVSYLIVLVFRIPTASDRYLELPWRLGLGGMASLFTCLVLVWFPRMRIPGGLALLGLALVHVMQESRGLALLTALTGLIGLYAALFGASRPPIIRAPNLLKILLLFSVASVATYQGARIATEERLFAPDLQRKMERQFSSRFGFLAAARAPNAAAIYAISKQPIIGYGAGNVDRDVLLLYGLLAASMYNTQSQYDAIFREAYAKKGLGTPSHSHLLGAWADAGILAALCWVAVLVLCAYVFLRSWRWRNNWNYLYVYTSLVVAWDVLLSPGPVRLQMAVLLLILAHAVRSIRSADASSEARKAGMTDRRYPELAHESA